MSQVAANIQSTKGISRGSEWLLEINSVSVMENTASQASLLPASAAIEAARPTAGRRPGNNPSTKQN